MGKNKTNSKPLSSEQIKDALIEGSKLAFTRLVERKRKEDGYLVISQNGKVVKVKASDIQLPK